MSSVFLDPLEQVHLEFKLSDSVFDFEEIQPKSWVFQFDFNGLKLSFWAMNFHWLVDVRDLSCLSNNCGYLSLFFLT